MLETADELASLQELFDASLGRPGEHLRGIIHPGSRTPSAHHNPAVSVSYVDGERFARRSCTTFHPGTNERGTNLAHTAPIASAAMRVWSTPPERA